MPTGPVAPAGGQPAGPGQFARGAAGVPPPPQRDSDTGYTYAHTSVVPPGGQPSPGGAPGAPAAPGRNRRTGMIALAAGIGALVLILCIGGGIFLVNRLGDDDKKPTAGNGTPTSAPAPGETEFVDCDDLKGKPIASVRNHLEKTDGFTVKETEVDDAARPGTVVDVSPCGDQPKGSEVEVKVSTGRRGNGGASGGPNATCTNGFPFGNQCPPASRR
jgi:hypothetical protein